MFRVKLFLGKCAISVSIMGSGAEKRWLLPVLIGLGVMFFFFLGRRLGTPVPAQADPQVGGDGKIMVVPIQIARENYGLAMVDTVSQTLWIYEINNRGPVHRRLSLLAARSWQYDRLLERYNTDEPKPEQVRILLEELGRPSKQQSKGKLKDSGLGILQMAEPDEKRLDYGE
ncbi:MAG: hypothetical protein ACYSTZ_07155 [Planctomycetota bacterium]